MKKETDASSYIENSAFEKERIRGNLVLSDHDSRVTQKLSFNKKIISYSLYGEEPGYCEGAILNAIAMNSIYPTWEMWVFHDESVPDHVLHRLNEAGAITTHAKEWSAEKWPGTFWRFLACNIEGAGYVVFRDTDSIISFREKELVDSWMSSTQPFHIIRDWYSHTDLILAGLWGAFAPLLKDIKDEINSYIEKNELHQTHADQHFLAECIWPRIKKFSLIHDSIHEGFNITSFSKPDHMNSGQNALGGYRYKKFAIDTNTKEDSSYFLTLLDESGNIIFKYKRKFNLGKDSFSLPYEYADKIDEKKYKMILNKIS